MVSWLRGTKLRFKLEYSCHRPPLESVFLNLVISETIQWKLSRPRLFRDSNFLFLRDRDFSRLQIFKSLETETFPRLQFRVFRDRDFPRLGKSCRDRDFFETLADLCDIWKQSRNLGGKLEIFWKIKNLEIILKFGNNIEIWRKIFRFWKKKLKIWNTI